MKKILCSLLAIVFLLTAPLWADDISVRKAALDNGLTVLVHEMPSSPVVSIFALVKTGSANERGYLASGITHFVEHMLFKGTERRGPGVIPSEAKALGGVINASTGYDFTIFTLTLPKANFAQGLDLIADMMQNAAFLSDEVEKERDVILREMNMMNDKPDRKLDDLLSRTVYLSHPYQYPIIGCPRIFKALTRDDLLKYYRTFYVPNNMVLSIAGGVQTRDVLPGIKAAFDGFEPRSFPLRNLSQEKDQIFPRFAEEIYPTGLVRTVMAYQGIPVLHKDLYALDVLAMALGGGQSSRLYRELYEKKGLVESISASNYTPMDRGYFEIAALLKEDNVDEVAAEVKKVIARVQKNGLLSDELAKVKRQVRVSRVYSRETSGSMAYQMALEEAMTGDPAFSDKYVEGTCAVTNDQIKRVARQYLVDDHLTVAVLRPQAQQRSFAAEEALEKNKIEEIVLNNGLRVLLRDDPFLPLVSIYAVMNAGIRQEPLELNGLSELTVRVWKKGFKGKTAEEITREIESRGGSFSIGTGMNSFGIELNGLAEDTDFFLDDLEGFLKHPTFPAQEIVKEKDQMRIALVARQDSIIGTTSQALKELLFKEHPFRLDLLGTEETLDRITRKDLEDCYNRFLSPDNMVIAVFGNIDKECVRDELEKRFGDLKPKPVTLRTVHEDAPSSLRFEELTMPREQALVMFGFHGPLIQGEERYAMDTAVNILTSSLDGRMFKRIREELGKAYALRGGFTPGVETGMTIFFALTTNENIDQVREIMAEELRKLCDSPVPVEELERAKGYLKSTFAMDMQTVSSQTRQSALDELLGLGYQDYQTYNAKIDAVTPAMVQTVARKYLDPSRAAVVVTRSEGERVK